MNKFEILTDTDPTNLAINLEEFTVFLTGTPEFLQFKSIQYSSAVLSVGELVNNIQYSVLIHWLIKSETEREKPDFGWVDLSN
jgi:hypothetical protein